MSPKKGRALDIGCGSGLLVEKLASYYAEVVGIDISDQMLEIAKYKRQRSNTVYLNMDAEHLNFKEKFDMIVSRTTYQTLDRKSTRLNSSHVAISYAVFCLKKKNRKKKHEQRENEQQNDKIKVNWRSI